MRLARPGHHPLHSPAAPASSLRRRHPVVRAEAPSPSHAARLSPDPDLTATTAAATATARQYPDPSTGPPPVSSRVARTGCDAADVSLGALDAIGGAEVSLTSRTDGDHHEP